MELRSSTEETTLSASVPNACASGLAIDGSPVSCSATGAPLSACAEYISIKIQKARGRKTFARFLHLGVGECYPQFIHFAGNEELVDILNFGSKKGSIANSFLTGASQTRDTGICVGTVQRRKNSCQGGVGVCFKSCKINRRLLMGKNKLKKFAEMREFKCVLQYPREELIKNGFPYRGSWNESVFGHVAPIVVELGCGKGEPDNYFFSAERFRHIFLCPGSGLRQYNSVHAAYRHFIYRMV